MELNNQEQILAELRKKGLIKDSTLCSAKIDILKDLDNKIDANLDLLNKIKSNKDALNEVSVKLKAVS